MDKTNRKNTPNQSKDGLISSAPSRRSRPIADQSLSKGLSEVDMPDDYMSTIDTSPELATSGSTTQPSQPLRLSTPRKYTPVNRQDSNIEELVSPVSTPAPDTAAPSQPDEATDASSLKNPCSSTAEVLRDDDSAELVVVETASFKEADTIKSDSNESTAASDQQARQYEAFDVEVADFDAGDAPDSAVKVGPSARIETITPNLTPGVLSRGVGAYAQWRADLRDSVESFRSWLREQKISDAQTEDRLDAILTAISDDKLHAAFVAEFSRGKSELINAIFFGGMDRRVLPSSAGRTTMCPTELLYDPGQPVGVRLLDIKTRLSERSIAEYKLEPDAWQFHAFDPENAEAVRNVLDVVTETREVSYEQASEMALTNPAAGEGDCAPVDGADEDSPVSEVNVREIKANASDSATVEIPRWRHAIINYPHPLLEQGLVVLDTPGLNALGVEPELTLNMLAQAHAVVFILAADAGVTASDMAVWENHIRVRERASEKGKLVALNKIDFLWDELLSDDEIESEQQRMVRETAGRLAIPSSSIFPLSAQKALVGKIKDEEELIRKSRIREFEYALANMLVPAKTDIVRDNVRGQLDAISTGINAIVGQRLQDVDDHMTELEQLNSKNMQVIEDMMEKVRTDKDSLETNLHRFQSTRQSFTQHSTELYNRLSLARLEQCIMETKRDMELSLTTPGLRGRIVRFFQQTENMLTEASAGASDIQEMMEDVYRVFQEENGLAQVQPRTFDIERYQRELEELQENQNHFVNGLGVVFIEQKRLVRKFFDSVVYEVRQIFERCTRDADTWLKTIMSPMESQVREHQIQLRRRLESIKRIHQASDTLEDRVAEIEQFRSAIMDQQASLKKHSDTLERILSRQLTEALLHDTAA